ncbi:MAG: ADOP family duplicated permease, partial [Gemmatimonadaceae bacterium]
FAARAARDGGARAAGWYWAQALVSAPWLLAARVRRRPRASPAPASGDSMLTSMKNDLGYAFRRARRHPLVSGTVVLSTALGLAAATAVFSVVDALLLRPLPLPEPEGLVRVVGVDTRHPEAGGFGGVSLPNARDVGARSRALERIAAYNPNQSGTLLHAGRARPVEYARVGEGFAEVLGVRAALGRTFVPEEHTPGVRVALLTHEGWRRELAGDSSVVGRAIVVDDEPYTVVGVLPPTRLAFPKENLLFWTPLAPPTTGPGSWRSMRSAAWLLTVARLRPGATLEGAQEELDALARSLGREYPDDNRSLGFRVVRLQDAIIGPVRAVVWLLAGAVGVVLLVACGNVAMLLLAHAQARRREFAVRAALGGGARRIVAQVLAESLALVGLGGAIGVAAAPAIVSAFLAIYPGPLPRAAEVALDARVGAAALLALAVAGVLAGLPAARQARRPALGDALRDAGRSGATRRERRAGATLVGAQVAFSVVLLCAAGVLLRSYWNLTRVDLGFEPRGVLTFWLMPTDARQRPPSQLYAELARRLRAIPGVRDVATSYDLPTAGRTFGTDRLVREGTDDTPTTGPTALVQMVSPRLLAALGTPLRAGRDFDERDRPGAPRVVIVNETFAARMFPAGDALGRRVTVHGEPHTIVGIAADSRLGLSPWDPPGPQMYFAVDQMDQAWRYVVIRAAGDPMALVPAVRAELARVDPTLPLAELTTLEERVRRSMAPQRFRGVLLGALSALALALSAVGIYGAAAYSVARRTRELGIRLALGETQRALRRRVVALALAPAAAGTAVGVAITLLAARWLERFTLGVAAGDGATLATVAALFLAATALAAYGPARRASRVDPVTALRAD